MDPQWDIHTLTGALKLFFRELKEPLFPFKSVNKFLDAASKSFFKRDCSVLLISGFKPLSRGVGG